MTLKPTFDNILVKKKEQESKTAHGIIIPDSAKEKPLFGTIVAVGSGKRTDAGDLLPMSLKVGQEVLFSKWNGNNEIKYKDETLVIMKESDIIAVVE
jgi:chaperonin GroES